MQATASRPSGLELGWAHSALVDGDRLHRESARPQQIEQCRVARVLDRDAIARAQVHIEDALESYARRAEIALLK